MENAARDDLKLAIYFLEKGGQPKIKGTELCPMARYIQFEEENQRKHNKTENLNEILAFKKQLIEKYNVQFNKNYGENLFQEDLKREKGT